MHRVIIFVLIVGTFLSSDVLAGQINLKNGDRLTGTIVRSDGKTLTMKSEYAGNVTVPWDAVERISSEEPLYLTLKDGQIVVGTVATAADQLQIDTKEAGRVTISKDAVTAVRSEAEQGAYLAELDRLRNPGLLDLWAGAIDVGLSLSQGNAETTTVNLALNAARTTPRDKISVYATSLYATNGTTGRSLTTANAIRGGARYELNITDRVFGFGFGDLEFDEFQDLDLRLVLGGGLGWHVKKTETTTFDVFGGGTYNREFFSTGLNRTSGEGQVGEEFTHQLSDRVQFKERLVFFPNLSDVGEYRLNFDTSLVTSLNKWLAWHVTLSDRFLSNPAPGREKNDLLLTTGLRITFAK